MLTCTVGLLRYFKLFGVQVFLCTFGIVYAVALVCGVLTYIDFGVVSGLGVWVFVLMFAPNLC